MHLQVLGNSLPYARFYLLLCDRWERKGRVHWVRDQSQMIHHPRSYFAFRDTLFQGGCGRFFEGTPAEMCSSLSYLAKLPNDTLVYNGHEYTADNLRFAKTVEPDNSALIQLQALIDSNEITTGKSTIGDEKEWNVFMRLDSSAIKYVVSRLCGLPLTLPSTGRLRASLTRTK